MSTTDERLAALSARRSEAHDDALAPDSYHRGAPEVATYRNPTLWVAIGAITAWTIGIAGYLFGPVPFALSVLITSIGTYIGFTVLHESVHRVAHQNRVVNDLLGRPFAWSLWFTYPVFRTCHLRHHANTNDEENDPDHWVSRGNALTRPFFIVTTSTRYWTLARRHGWVTRGQLWTQTAMYYVLWSVVIGLVVAGRIDIVGITLLPTILAGFVLYFTLDYLPHTPFESTERFYDTRIQRGRVRHVLLLGQNYHLIHHLWVSVPWYRYRQVFDELEPELRARGARIE